MTTTTTHHENTLWNHGNGIATIWYYYGNTKIHEIALDQKDKENIEYYLNNVPAEVELLRSELDKKAPKKRTSRKVSAATGKKETKEKEPEETPVQIEYVECNDSQYEADIEGIISMHEANVTNKEEKLSEEQIKKFILQSHFKAYDKQESKRLRGYLKNKLPIILKSNFYMHGVTCIVSPELLKQRGHFENVNSAWKAIKQNLEICINNLRKVNEVMFVLVTVEEHTSSKNKKKTKTDEQESSETQEKESQKDTLKGFPHLHLAIAFAKYGPDPIQDHELWNYFYPYFDDIDIDGNFKVKQGKECKRRGNPSILGSEGDNLIGYVLKNSRHLIPFIKLKATLPVMLYDFTADDTVKNFFGSLEAFNIFYTYFRCEDHTKGHNYSKKIVKPKTKTDDALTVVLTDMEEKGYCLYRGRIYMREPGSKKTFRFIGIENDEYFDSIITRENFGLMTTNKDRIVDQMFSNSTKKVFPMINISYEWFEFADFFVHFTTDKITYHKECPYYCCSFFPNIKWEDRLQRQIPELWYSIIQNQEFTKDEEQTLLKRLYTIIIPKILKDRSIYLIGKPNSGKTTLIQAVIELFPEDCIYVISKRSGNFMLEDLADSNEKVILFCDEVGGILSLGTADLLKIFEGQARLQINRKNKRAVKRSINCTITLSSNKDLFLTPSFKKSKCDTSEDEDYEGELNLKKAYDIRLDKYNFTKPLPYCDPLAKQKITEEKAKIFFFLADHFYTQANNKLELQ